MSGFAAVLKPPGIPTQRFLHRLRQRLRRPGLGHFGTLDPLAAGVLVVADGFARRLFDVVRWDKHYVAEIWLGVATTTDDLEGEATQERDASHLTAERVSAAVAQFVGTFPQVPPLYSAAWVAGERSYRRAQKGVRQPPPPRTVTVHDFSPLTFQPGRRAVLRARLHVSSGTYVRSLARDLGQRLGVGGCLAALVRTAVGPFHLADATLPEEAPRFHQPSAVLDLPVRPLSEDEWRRVRTGQDIPADVHHPLWLATYRQETVALLTHRGGRLWPRRVAAEVTPS